MTPENQAEMEKLVAAKVAELKAVCAERGSVEERIDFLLLLVAMQSVVVDGALEQLAFEIAALSACLPKADVERAKAAIEQAKAEKAAAR